MLPAALRFNSKFDLKVNEQKEKAKFRLRWLMIDRDLIHSFLSISSARLSALRGESPFKSINEKKWDGKKRIWEKAKGKGNVTWGNINLKPDPKWAVQSCLCLHLFSLYLYLYLSLLFSSFKKSKGEGCSI